MAANSTLFGVIVIVLPAIGLLAGCAGSPTPAPELTAAAPVSGAAPSPPIGKPLLIYKGQTIRVGDRVTLTAWAGYFRPRETGHVVNVNADKGLSGSIIAAGPGLKDVWVRWDPQVYREVESGREVALESFVASVGLAWTNYNS